MITFSPCVEIHASIFFRHSGQMDSVFFFTEPVYTQKFLLSSLVGILISVIFWSSGKKMEKSVSREQKGWMARRYLIPERMAVRWGGLRAGKDTSCRVPPLKGKRSVISYHFFELILNITELRMLTQVYLDFILVFIK